MLTFEYNKQRNSIEIYGDEEGLRLLMKRINALIRKDEGSYFAYGQGQEGANGKGNILSDYYTIMLFSPPEEGEKENNNDFVYDGA